MGWIKRLIVLMSGEIWHIQKAPTEGGGHTSYELCRRKRSREVRPSPLANFCLTTTENQENDRKFVEQLGYKLIIG